MKLRKEGLKLFFQIVGTWKFEEVPGSKQAYNTRKLLWGFR
jgi:hypothetical protein